jgi:hypothetical protein
VKIPEGIRRNALLITLGALGLLVGAVLFGIKVIADQGGHIEALVQANEERDAREAKQNAANIASRDAQLREIKATADLLKDCVGLSPGGECLRRLQELSREQNEREQRELIEALRREFGILKGELVITVVQREGQPTEIRVGGQEPGRAPTRQAPLPPGTTVQECVVELHAEPVVGACVVPR